jgi:flagellar basal-body rod protein FlgF
MSEMAAQIGSRLDGLTREFDTVAHNLANMNTIGYKRRCNTFSKSLIAQGAGTKAQVGDKIDTNVTFDFTQGSTNSTGRTLDFALLGKGFFVIETPEGPLYTRNGMFRLNQNGQIVDSAGRNVAGDSGPITIPNTVSDSQITVSSDGSVSAGGAVVGKFKLVSFKEDENKLFAVGTSCFKAPANVKPADADKLVVRQGFQEASNVQMTEELVDMIMVSRLYESNMKFLSATRDTSKSLLDVAGG